MWADWRRFKSETMLTQDQTLDQTALVERSMVGSHYVLHSQGYYRDHPDYEDFYQGTLHSSSGTLAHKFQSQPGIVAAASLAIKPTRATISGIWPRPPAAGSIRKPLGLLGNGGGLSRFG